MARFEKERAKEVGIWDIFGEDPNCDFGGHHSNPYLGTVEGSYEDAYAYAMTLAGFYTWGGGGYLTKKSEPQIINVEGFANDGKERRKAELEKQMAELQEQMAKIKDEMEGL